MNPPTIGHEKLVHKVIETSRCVDGDHILFLSQSQNNTTDPLDWKFKIRVCEAAFPGVKISKNSEIRNPFQALATFKDIYENVILIVGGDQVDEFTKRMTPYAMSWGFEEFKIISAGDRIDEAIGVEGMSATKMRNFACLNNKQEFFKGLAGNLPLAVKNLIYEKVKKGLKK